MPYIITNSSFLPKRPRTLSAQRRYSRIHIILKIQESIYDRLFLLLWSIWRPAVLTFRKIIILPLYDSTFSLGLRNIQVCHMETVLLLHPRLNLLICSPLLEPGHVHVFEREFHSDILTRNVSLGKLNNRLHVARENEIDSHSSCLFAKSRSGTYPRFRLFALMPPGTYPRFLGSQGTYPPVFAH